MQQHFFERSDESNFIKQLLSSIPLPFYRVIYDGNVVITGYIYIYKCNLIKCTRSGIINISAKYIVLDHYDLYNYNNQISEFYHSKYNYYDSDTHEKLGELLRAYKGIQNLNLMPFYNCFSNRYISGLKVGVSSLSNKLEVYQSRDTSIKTALIPIKYNTDYTIALDCASSVYAAPVLIDDGMMVGIREAENQISITKMLGNIKDNIKVWNGMSFKTPMIYKVSTTDENLETIVASEYMNSFRLSYENVIDIKQVKIKRASSDIFYMTDFYTYDAYTKTVRLTNNLYLYPGDAIQVTEVINNKADIFEKYARYLYLLLQIPASDNSSITVLEGDYLRAESKKVFNVEMIDELPENRLDELLVGNLRLLQMSDSNQHPFSETLIEYLLHNVITNLETLPKNIKNVQNALGIGLDLKRYGIWNRDLRNSIYQIYYKSRSGLNLDNIGFIDKDIEHFLATGGN